MLLQHSHATRTILAFIIIFSYHHVLCFNIPRTQEIQDPHEWVQQVLKDETKNALLSDETECAKVVADIAAKVQKKIKKDMEDTTPSSKLDKFNAMLTQEKKSQKQRQTKNRKKERQYDQDDHDDDYDYDNNDTATVKKRPRTSNKNLSLTLMKNHF
jgi:hypothetical protein